MPMIKTLCGLMEGCSRQSQVSLEEKMACGLGACLGCVIESVSEKEGEKMLRVCADGPVFDTALIDWEAHNLAYGL
jgi:dihydroorotate dehydrogenase electron transfer subunit